LAKSVQNPTQDRKEGAVENTWKILGDTDETVGGLTAKRAAGSLT